LAASDGHPFIGKAARPPVFALISFFSFPFPLSPPQRLPFSGLDREKRCKTLLESVPE
jgi:hypothetical protein